MSTTSVQLRLNGRPVSLPATPTTSLLRALRDAGHTGTKGACEQGECGSCSVLLDDDLVCSCLVPAAVCADAEVTTIEGGVASDLADALGRHGAVQCGFCTPGVVMAAEHALQIAARSEEPLDRSVVLEALAGNLCRCTGYHGIVAAVLEVDLLRRERRP